jgi:hypothetical protein
MQGKKSQAKTAKEVRKTRQAEAAIAKTARGFAKDDFARHNAYEADKRKLRAVVGRKAATLRANAALAAKLYEKIAANLTANNLAGKFQSDLDTISRTITAGLAETASIDLNTTNLDELSALGIEIDTAGWVVKEGRVRLVRLEKEINEEVRLIAVREREDIRAAKAEASALEEAAKDAQLADEQAQFAAEAQRKRQELTEWQRLKMLIAAERRALKREMVALATLVGGSR